MIRKVDEQYYEMGFVLMGGIVVDEELKNKMEVVLSQAKKAIFALIDDNPEHYRESCYCSAFPHGKQVSFNYEQPKGQFDLGVDSCKQTLEQAFTMREVKYLFESDERMPIDEIKAFAQKAIEEETDVNNKEQQYPLWRL